MFQLLDRIKRTCIAYFPYIISRFFAIFLPLNKNKFFFLSMGGTNYGDSMKSLSDYISSHHSNAQIVWAFDKQHYKLIQSNSIKVRMYSFQYYFHQITSTYFITNQGCSDIVFSKRKGQVKVQTWHGTALKRLGKDAKSQDWPKWMLRFKPKAMKNELRDTDIFISGSSFMTEVYKRAYEYPRMIYETGIPRNDIFFTARKDVKQKVCNFFDIPESVGILLYAPTFRNNGDISCYNFSFDILKGYLAEKYSKNYVLLVRLHPVMMSKIDELSDFLPNMVNANMYPDMQELLYTADALITDYSSTMFDFMYSYKPVILYVPDRDTYNRGFYFDIDKLPFIVVNNNSEIISKISKFDMEQYRKSIEVFMGEIGSVEDGHATPRVYNLMMNYNKG